MVKGGTEEKGTVKGWDRRVGGRRASLELPDVTRVSVRLQREEKKVD